MLKLFLLFFAISGIFNELCAEKIKHNNTLSHDKGAKYIFLFIGDGMGAGQRIVAEKAFGTKKHPRLWMNTLPVKALVNTLSYGDRITDSAAAGTALACGKKTQNEMLGLDHKGKPVESVAEMAKKLGWKIGIISSVPLNNATPAAFYAHQPKRYMYGEIIKNLAGSGFDYFGGSSFIIKNRGQEALKDNNYILIKASEKMPQLDSNKKYIIHSKLPYVIDRNKDSGLNLADYTRLGIKHIYTGAGKTKGFFMMVEGGKIDWSCHANDGGGMIHEVKIFDNAVKVALDFYKRHPDSTTIIITADHETGGLRFFPNVKPAQLLKQKHSYAAMCRKLSKYKKERITFKKLIALLQTNYGIKKFSPEELNKLRKAFTKKKKGEHKNRILYGSYKPLLLCMQRIFNKRCGLKWTTTGHSALPVPLSAIGVGSKIFDGYYENTQIAHKLKSLIKPVAKK
jgi:alkaline phosphatase